MNAGQAFPSKALDRTGGKGFAGDMALDVEIMTFSNEIANPSKLTCPTDNRKPARDWSFLGNSNLSYFVDRDAGILSWTGFRLPEETKLRAILGDRNVTNRLAQTAGMINVAGDKQVGWTRQMHEFVGNVASEDGSVYMVPSAVLQEMVIKRKSCRLVLP